MKKFIYVFSAADKEVLEAAGLERVRLAIR